MSKAKVLVVDDERLNIDILVSVLSYDYDVIVAKNGEQAIKRVEEQKPDVILLDILMPDMNGYQVLEALQKLPEAKKIPVIFITAKRTPEEELIGLQMGAADYISKPFTPALVQVRVANQIKYKRNQDKLEKLNKTDPLTGIANRRHFDEYFNMQRESCLRANVPLSLIMLDIDFFKNYNDYYGHSAGDDVLNQVAVALQINLERTTDLVARYGGEEFTIVLPATDAVGAELCAHKLHQAVKHLGIEHDASEAGKILTASLGVATIQADKDKTGDDLFKAADNALYKAKSAGRDQYKLNPL